MESEPRSGVQITVHSCEKINLDRVYFQPVVCMYIVDSTNGNYIKKQDRNEPGFSFYENQRNDIDYFIPIMSRPCTSQSDKSHLLIWEEDFILNENLDYLLRKELNTILFFEVTDLVPSCSKKHNYERLAEKGKQVIAWAFLKLVCQNGNINTGSRLRLQLYKPYPPRKKSKPTVEIFQWWSEKPRIYFQASLFISIQEFKQFPVNPALRSFLPLQEEKSSQNQVGLRSDVFRSEISKPSEDGEKREEDFSLRRKKGEDCKIPRTLSLSLENSHHCQLVKFSPSGRILATSTGSSSQYFLVFYEMLSGGIMQKMLAHLDVIHDLEWSDNGKFILSSSADYNVKLWNVITWMLVASFAHPSFVYSAKFSPISDTTIFTACNDHVIRVWSFGDKNVRVLQELEGHKSSVNALCWQERKQRLISADSLGTVKVWKIEHSGNSNSSFCLEDKELNFPELQGVPIEKMYYDNSKSVLFLFCGDNTVKLLDIKKERKLSSIRSITKPQIRSTGCCSPCGTLLFVCNNNDNISVWNLLSGVPTSFFDDPIHYNISSIDYHPLDHVIAFSTDNENACIFIYTYKSSDENEHIIPKQNKLFSAVRRAIEADLVLTNSSSSKNKYHYEKAESKDKYNPTVGSVLGNKQSCVQEISDRNSLDSSVDTSARALDENPGIKSSKRIERRKKLNDKKKL